MTETENPPTWYEVNGVKPTDWHEMHLPDNTFRAAIAMYLETRGYEVDASTLHIYGYGHLAAATPLTAFQGHVTMRVKSEQ